MGDSFNKYIIKRINENNGNCGSLYMPGSAFVGTWRDNPNIYLVKNTANSPPERQKSMPGEIDITEVIEDAFYRIHIRRGSTDNKWTYEFYSTMMYNDGIITGQMDVNNYSIFYFDINGRLVQQFQQLNVNTETGTEILYAKSYLTKVTD